MKPAASPLSMFPKINLKKTTKTVLYTLTQDIGSLPSHLLAPNVPKKQQEKRQKFQELLSSVISNFCIPYSCSISGCKGEFFWIFSLLYSTLLHLPPLRFHCVGGYWDRTQDSCDFGIGFQRLYPHGYILSTVRLHPVATSALAFRRTNHTATSYPQFGYISATLGYISSTL
jgi:hypothetical protein